MGRVALGQRMSPLWTIRELEVQIAEYDFSSAGLSAQHRDRALVTEGVTIANQLGAADVEAGAFQATICTECGMQGCEPGGWLKFRRLADGLVWIPCFSETDADPQARNELGPPEFVRKRGAPFFHGASLEILRTVAPHLAGHAELQELSSTELLRMLALYSPKGVLKWTGDSFSLREDVFSAVDEGDLSDHIKAFRRALSLAVQRNGPVHLKPKGQPVTFYIDAAATIPWSPISRDAEGHLLLTSSDEQFDFEVSQ